MVTSVGPIYVVYSRRAEQTRISNIAFDPYQLMVLEFLYGIKYFFLIILKPVGIYDKMYST
jgi:hypothetical protein